MRHQTSIAALAVLASTGAALASISTYTSDTTLIADDTHNANFNTLVNDQSLMNYQEDGLQVSVNRSYFSWNAPGFDGSELFYASTGALSPVDISLVSGEDFTDIDMQISSGWTPDHVGTAYLWVQLYDNGDNVASLDIDMTTGDYLGFVGGGFDQIRIGAYASAALRDAHNETLRNAIAIDNISVGTFVPAPGTLMVSSLGLIALRRRRRA